MARPQMLMQWQTMEFEPRETGRSFYILSGVFLLSVIAYALATNSPVMAITFILIGIMGYVMLERDPKTLHCAITEEGIIVDKDLYAFEHIESFWIIYEEDERVISLKTDGKLTPFVHVPLGDEDPTAIRDLLLHYAREEKHEPRLVDTIEKMLHIR